MAIYRNIQLSFWTDNKVEDEFTPEDKYFYLYLMTNPQTNLCGCYEVSYSQLTNQTGYSKDTINRLLDRFENVHGVIKFDKNNKEILLLNWSKYNWSKSPDTLKGVENVAKYIKTDSFREYVLSAVESLRGDISNQSSVCDDFESVLIAESKSKKMRQEEQLNKDFQTIYNYYPKKVGRTRAFGRYKRWITSGKVVNGSRRKLTNRQIWDAISNYKEKMEQEGSDLQYYKNFDTFMGDSILDYVD